MRRLEWEGNGFQTSHPILRIEVDNYGGYDVEVDDFYVWEDPSDQ